MGVTAVGTVQAVRTQIVPDRIVPRNSTSE